MDKYIQKIMRKFGYVRFSHSKEELYEAAAESYTNGTTITVYGEIWNFKISVIKPWMKFDKS